MAVIGTRQTKNISDADAIDLTDGGDSTLHFHSSDRARANHTGTQAASTISDFDTEVSNNTSVTANTAKVSADGSVTTHNDVTDAGSGSIITTLERSAVTANTAKVSADGSIDTHSDVDTTTSTPSVGDVLEWDGTDWVPATPAAGGSGTRCKIHELHVDTTSSQSLTGGTRATITNLSISVTPETTSSKLFITARWCGETDDAQFYNSVFGLRRGTTDIGNPASAGDRPLGIGLTSMGFYNSDNADTPDSAIINYVDEPNTTSLTTYTMTILARTSSTLYNNRAVDDNDNTLNERLTSSIIIVENY